jgi:hypothetical protein
MKPVRVKEKTRLGVGPVKPGRPGTQATQSNPPESWSFFYILIDVKRRRFGLDFAPLLFSMIKLQI